MRLGLVMLFLGTLVTSLVAQSAPPRIEPKDASKFIGKLVTVCGRVVTTGCNTRTRITTLAFSAQLPATRFRVNIPASLRPESEPRFEEKFLLRNACATGIITKGTAGEEMNLSESAQFSFESDTIATPFAPHAHWPCEATVTVPKVTKEVKPSYTPNAMARQIQGTVIMQAVVEHGGVPGDIRVLGSLDPELDDQAVHALRGWRFQPGTFQGEPAAIIVTVELTFMLRSGR
jgi:TonB family protein